MYYVQNSRLISGVQLHQETQLHYENIALSELVQVSHIKLFEPKTDTAIRNYWKKYGVYHCCVGLWANFHIMQ